jgi:hypothetical protein
MTGATPKVKIEPVKQDGSKPKNTTEALKQIIGEITEEQKKYIKCWDLPDYRRYSPGEELVDMFLDLDPKEDTTLIDWGCGTGRAALKIKQERPDLDVTMVDFAFNCLDKKVKKKTKSIKNFRFIEHDLTKKTDLQSEYGFCTDVMEHIPTEDVDDVLTHILYASKHVFFQISTADDIFSRHKDLDVDSELHLTVKSYHWWLRKFSDQRCLIHRSKDCGNAVIFFVTGWGKKVLTWDGYNVNTPEEKVKENIAANAKLGIQPIKPHGGDGETEIMLLCGGPTLNDFEDEIKQKREAGVKCITTNGSYNWCLERGIKPSLQCMIDARPFMLRMVEQVEGLTDETKYAISSQCDPSIFEVLPHDRTYMWHVSLSQKLISYISEHFGDMYEGWWPSPGGSTVGLRAIMLLRMLGFNRVHVYGMDSCVFPERHHHAYEQKENDYLDERGTIPVVVAKGTKWEKAFDCQPWHVFQMCEFQDMVPHLPDDLQLNVCGDGLISYFIEAAAELAKEDKEIDFDFDLSEQPYEVKSSLS